MNEVPVLTIDGPSGSGKGTISQLVARQLGWHMLDSGALYRLVAYGAQKHAISLENEAKLAEYARNMDVIFQLPAGGGEPQILLEGELVGAELRTEHTGNAASKVAAIQSVRDALLQRQRDFRQAPGLVADGRDMGTTIFPQAQLKIFLTASAEERAQRRYKQLKQKGIDANLADLFRDISERDLRDSQRLVSPLKAADDAVTIDTSSMGIDEVVNEVLRRCQQAFSFISL